MSAKIKRSSLNGLALPELLEVFESLSAEIDESEVPEVFTSETVPETCSDEDKATLINLMWNAIPESDREDDLNPVSPVRGKKKSETVAETEAKPVKGAKGKPAKPAATEEVAEKTHKPRSTVRNSTIDFPISLENPLKAGTLRGMAFELGLRPQGVTADEAHIEILRVRGSNVGGPFHWAVNFGRDLYRAEFEPKAAKEGQLHLVQTKELRVEGKTKSVILRVKSDVTKDYVIGSLYGGKNAVNAKPAPVAKPAPAVKATKPVKVETAPESAKTTKPVKVTPKKVARKTAKIKKGKKR